MVVWEALDALSHQLELCQINPTSAVVVLLDQSVDHAKTALIRAAVTRTGATAVEVRPLVSAERAASDPQNLLPSIARSATVVISMGASPFESVVASAVDKEDCAHLHVLDHVAPQWYPPHANLARRVTALTSHIQGATSLTVTDSHGTDLHINLQECEPRSDRGLIGHAQRAATFPAGWAGATPARATVHGEVVLMPGDANITGRRLVSSPLRLTIHDDLIAAIDGESPDADVIRALLEYSGDPSAYGIAGFSLGMNPGTQALTTFDDRLLDPALCRLSAGVVTLSFGENLVADRPCNQTITFGLRGRTAHLDGVPIITAGALEGDFAPDVYEV